MIRSEIKGAHALVAGCALFRRSVPNRAQEHTAESEHGAKAGNQSDKETKREDGIQTDYI